MSIIIKSEPLFDIKPLGIDVQEEYTNMLVMLFGINIGPNPSPDGDNGNMPEVPGTTGGDAPAPGPQNPN